MLRGAKPYKKCKYLLHYFLNTPMEYLETCCRIYVIIHFHVWIVSTRGRRRKPRSHVPRRSVHLTKAVERLSITVDKKRSAARVTFSPQHTVHYEVDTDQSSGTVTSTWIIVLNIPMEYSYWILVWNTHTEYSCGILASHWTLLWNTPLEYSYWILLLNISQLLVINLVSNNNLSWILLLNTSTLIIICLLMW